MISIPNFVRLHAYGENKVPPAQINSFEFLFQIMESAFVAITYKVLRKLNKKHRSIGDFLNLVFNPFSRLQMRHARLGFALKDEIKKFRNIDSNSLNLWKVEISVGDNRPDILKNAEIDIVVREFLNPMHNITRHFPKIILLQKKFFQFHRCQEPKCILLIVLDSNEGVNFRRLETQALGRYI
uniref:Uncharacterized protein n=1 Tax=Rhizophagus irregularis (strain DAOM 181602 / DAOM 197198 / MUCL 43194) TaxID=747089 RepID=U9URK6_RHIID